MKITVVGCGNVGLIHAAKMYEKGLKVGLLKSSYSIHDNYFDLIVEEKGYNVVDATNDDNAFWVEPEFITRDVEKAVNFADIIFVATTTLQHESIAEKIAPFVKDGQTIVLVPGYMGSLIFKKYINKDVIYSEWETSAYNGRITNDEFVRISFYNPRNAISVLPVNKSEETLAKLSLLFDNTKYLRQNILESALHNPNMIVHTIGVLFSASRIEYSEGEFWMYKEAFTESVIRVINEFDKQKNKVLNSFGCQPLNYFDAAKWRNEEDLTLDSMLVFKTFAEVSNKGPSSLFNRYIYEDVPMGLALFSSLGKIAGVDTSISDSIITLSSALLGVDLEKNSRTIQYLTDNKSVNIEYVKEVITK